MAETHRRVEPRGIVGTGMLNDPDRLRDIEQRAERFMRDRQLPKKKFGEVIATAPNTPPEGTELVDDEPQPDKRRKNQKAPDAPASDEKKAAEQPKAATFERRPPRGVGVIRPSAAPPKQAQKPAAPSTPPPPPSPAKDEKAASPTEKDRAKESARPMATGSRTPEQSKQTGGHTQVTFKI